MDPRSGESPSPPPVAPVSAQPPLPPPPLPLPTQAPTGPPPLSGPCVSPAPAPLGAVTVGSPVTSPVTAASLLVSKPPPALVPMTEGLHGTYSSPPPTVSANDPIANECKLIDYRGAKVAAFVVGGETMLCLPQAFELFLKHLVGGLHTVYTKLKRLDITPLVCNVEQVRILRGLGAIQPGVNRCKLLSCKDFDVLYKDCTTASSRPGRPPKRASLLGMSPSQETLLKLKKARLENGDYSSYENGHIAARLSLNGLNSLTDYLTLLSVPAGETRMEKSPLLANGYNHPPTHINPMPFMALNHPAHTATAILSPNSGIPLSAAHAVQRSEGSIIKERAYSAEVLARLKEEKAECDRSGVLALDHHRVRDLSQLNGEKPFLSSSSYYAIGSSNGHSPVLNLSQKSSGGGDHSGSEGPMNDGNEDDDDNISDVDDDDDKDQELSDCPDVTSTANGDRTSSAQNLTYASLLGDGAGGISSTETLLRNIQGLLKVAADNARQQERQINYEKAELKMEILRERELRENLEKQLMEEQRTRVLYQKRLKKEKKGRRRLQEQLEQEMKRRLQYEEALKSTSSDTLRILNDSLSQELEMERNGRTESERKLQGKIPECTIKIQSSSPRPLKPAPRFQDDNDSAAASLEPMCKNEEYAATTTTTSSTSTNHHVISRYLLSQSLY